MKNALPLLVLLLAACASDGLGIVAKGHVDGERVVATDGKRTLVFARGTADAGIYQVDDGGQLKLTRPLIAAHDAVRILDTTQKDAAGKDLDVTVKVGDLLPAWTLPVILMLLTTEEIAKLGLTWEPGV